MILKGTQPPFLVHASDDAKDFVYSCLMRKPQLRPTAWQLRRFPWIKVSGCVGLLEVAFQGDEGTWPGMTDVKEWQVTKVDF